MAGNEYKLDDRFLEIDKVISYVNICIGGLGILGNLVCARVMVADSLKDISSAVFFLFLGISDTIVIICELVGDVSKHIPSYTEDELLYGGNQWRCRFGTYGLESCKMISSWLVIALIAELYLATKNPVKANIVYTRWRSFRVSIYICLVACAGSLPFLVINSSDGEKCISKYKVFMDLYSDAIVRPVIIFITPLIVCVICLIKICITLSANDNTIIEQQASGSYTDDKVLEEVFKHGYQAKTGIIAIAILFLSTIIPSIVLDICHIISTYSSFIVFDFKWGVALEVARTLLLVNYSFKFYIIITLENDFKQAISSVSKCGAIQFHTSSEEVAEFHDLKTISNGITHNIPNTKNSDKAHVYANGAIARRSSVAHHERTTSIKSRSTSSIRRNSIKQNGTSASSNGLRRGSVQRRSISSNGSIPNGSLPHTNVTNYDTVYETEYDTVYDEPYLVF